MLALVFVLLSSLSTLKAIPAYPGIIEQKQSDGTILSYYLFGDEHFSWARTTDDYTIMRNQVGDYVYMIQDEKGDLIQSQIIAHNPELRNAAETLFLSTVDTKLFYSKEQMSLVKQSIEIIKAENAKAGRAFPTTGDRKLVCLLMQYPDRAMIKTQQEFEALFNTVGYNAYGATGSVKDYYLENSYNQFNLTVDVYGPYTAANNLAYYKDRASTLLREGIQQSNSVVDYTQYDNDNDNYVDAVYMIYAGYGQEAGASNAIWAHASSLVPSEQADGKYIRRYSCSPELRGNGGNQITNIGVICHEFGHVLGAMDYYDTDYETGGQYPGTGQWDLMAGGSWNNGGATPAHHNAFTKTIIYNWAKAKVLSQPSSITIHSTVTDSSSFYRVNTTTNNEYYILENRQLVGFDAALPGHGMIIYHVHSAVNSSGNKINATHPQKMYPVCASATTDPTSTPISYGSVNSISCAYPYSGKNSFTDATLPSSKSWAGANTEKPITEIMRNTAQKTISFEFMGGEGNPSIFKAQALSDSKIEIVWKHTHVDQMIMAYSNSGIFGTPTTGTTYNVGDTIEGGGKILYAGTDTSYIHTNLVASSPHYYKIWAKKNNVPEYSSGTTTFAYTHCNKVDRFPYHESFGTLIKPLCYEVVDSQGTGQVWMFNNPRNRKLKSTTGANGIAIIDSDYFGEGNTQNTQLVSCVFDFSEYQTVNISFEHAYNHKNSTARFMYSVDGGVTYQLAANYQTTTGSLITPAKATFDLSSQLGGQSNVKFKWSYSATHGSFWAIDDFKVTARDYKAISIKYLNNTYANGSKIIDYSVVNPGTSKEYQLYIHSTGDLPLNLTNSSVSQGKYTITTPPANTIQPGDSSLMVITYQPTAPGTDSTVVTIGNNTPINNPYTVIIKSNVATQFNATFTINDGVEPVEGATIVLNGSTTQTTNASGQATFNNVAAGTDIPYTVSKDAYNTITGTIKLIDSDQNFVVTMPRTDIQITFHLKNSNGANVTNSSVTVAGYGQQFTSGGKTTFTLPPLTDIHITCAATNYATHEETLNTGANSHTIEIIMERVSYTVNVAVKSMGNPVEGATVTLGNYPTQTTNNQGVATITKVKPTNSISLTVTKEGYHTYNANVSITNNTTLEVALATGIEENIFGNIKIYPIPTTGTIQIDNVTQITRYNITDISGRLFVSGLLHAGNNSLDISMLEAGMYNLTLYGNSKQQTYQLIKQ